MKCVGDDSKESESDKNPTNTHTHTNTCKQALAYTHTSFKESAYRRLHCKTEQLDVNFDVFVRVCVCVCAFACRWKRVAINHSVKWTITGKPREAKLSKRRARLGLALHVL